MNFQFCFDPECKELKVKQCITKKMWPSAFNRAATWSGKVNPNVMKDHPMIMKDAKVVI